VSYTEGALIEPFVVAIQGLRQSGFAFGSSAVVVGCGTIGLMMAQALRVAGAGTIISVDRIDGKMEIARRVGATHTLHGTPDIAEKVRELTDGLGAMYGFEAVGTEATYAQMASLVRDGATITLLGLLSDDGVPMPMSSSALRELKYTSVIRYTNVFKEAIAWLEAGRIDLKPVLSHEFSFKNANQAFEEALNNKTTAIKIVINI
jgi:L-iditol 2-dehydrogenase